MDSRQRRTAVKCRDDFIELINRYLHALTRPMSPIILLSLAAVTKAFDSICISIGTRGNEDAFLDFIEYALFVSTLPLRRRQRTKTFPWTCTQASATHGPRDEQFL
jgi:hypothetical protein